MSKVLIATCNASGKVTAGGVQIPTATVLSEGKQASSGILILDGDKAWYIALSSSDLKTTIDKVAQALQQAATGLNAAGAALNGMVPGTGASTIAAATQITPLVAELNTLKEALK